MQVAVSSFRNLIAGEGAGDMSKRAASLYVPLAEVKCEVSGRVTLR